MNLNLDLYWKEIQRSNEAALGKVLRIVFKPLVYYAREITGHHELAEEIVQDVILKIWEKRSDINIKGSFQSYLFNSVHNQSLNVLRQMRTHKESVNQTCSDEFFTLLSETCCSDGNFIEQIFSNETEVLINRVIKDLPPQCRDIFCKSRFERMNNAEIAEKMGLSEHTVKAHIYKALQKISRAIENDL